jgi:hypothetical protein
MAWLDWVSIVLVVAGVAGVLAAWLQWKRTTLIERTRREELWALLESTRNLIVDQTQVEQFAKKHDDQDLSRALWSNHQAASDLYVTLVGQYLAQERRFTYTELERLCEIGFVNRPWQEERWRFLLCRRQENVQAPAPPPSQVARVEVADRASAASGKRKADSKVADEQFSAFVASTPNGS